MGRGPGRDVRRAAWRPRRPDRAPSRVRLVARVQGLYYLATGVWALVSIRTFEAVTGPKTDRWLVKTVGVLVSVIGGSLAVVKRRRRVGPELMVLGMASAAGLAAIDTVYAARKRISSVYLLDAMVEMAVLAAWVIFGLTKESRR
jgi:hypothetical protein